MTSSDGFCSALTFAPGELGTVCQPPAPTATRQTPTPISVPPPSSTSSTPQATPTTSTSAPLSAPLPPAIPRPPSGQTNPINNTAILNPAGSPSTFSARPASPARSMSASSIATDASFARVPDQNALPAMNNPTPSLSAMPSVAAAGSNLPLFTPPQTPGHHANGSVGSVQGLNAALKRPSDASESSAAGIKRPNDSGDTPAEEAPKEKRRRIAPTPVTDSESSAPPPPPAGSS